jgi:4-diphosphocytidyl-2-C-methyl-D-erythritol kinase
VTVEEGAPAKINLTLRVLGRRADGYHVLESIVAFAEIGDLVGWRPALTEQPDAPESRPAVGRRAPPSVFVEGPFASQIEGENLVARAITALAKYHPNLPPGGVAIQKRLPIAAGVGGGSADAAAALRLLARVHPAIDPATLAAIAPGLGADVPVCLGSRPARIGGIGERVETLARFPAADVVLVNARHAMPGDKTARIFRALAAPPLAGEANLRPLPATATLADLVHLMQRDGNDLAAPALAILPGAAAALASLQEAAGCLAAALSGAGPTAFGLFAETSTAAAAAAAIARAEPGWWVVATRLRAVSTMIRGVE